MARAQTDLVADQFGRQAAAYLASPVHSAGPDLARIAEVASARRPAAALDLGCGGGHVAFALAPHAGAVVAYDLSPPMLATVADEAARRGHANLRTAQGAVEALPFPDASFDLVASRYSAHHWSDLDAALREARRVMKPGGLAVFSDIVAAPSPLLDTVLQAIELMRDPSHVRDYAEAEWRRALAAAGFAPGRALRTRVPIAFAPWIARQSTPAPMAEAIRDLMNAMSDPVKAHFALQPDGSFTLDALTLEAAPA